MQETDNTLREQVEAALLRAAQKARALAEQTHTPFIIWRDGKVINLTEAESQENETAPQPLFTQKP